MTLAALVPLPVVLPLLGAGINLLAGMRVRLQNLVTVITLVLVLCISGVLLWAADAQGIQVVAVGGWELPFGIALVVDRLSALMLVVSMLVTLSVFIYAVGQEMTDDSQQSPVSVFNPAYLILCAGVAGSFIAGDLFNLYVGFEMLLVASFVLITIGVTPERVRVGATYIVVSLLSSLIFLGSIGLIYAATGTVNMADLAVKLSMLPEDVQLFLHIALLLGFGIKAAVFPLSFWLPDSYPTAPAPVTAVFAGLLTKVGIYAIIRTETLLFFGQSLRTPLLIVAGLTLIVGILGAVAQTDLKRMLSFTLVSHIGYLLFGVALGTELGLAAALYYTVHHIVVQTTLFLAVGLIEQRTGTTKISALGGLMTLSPALSWIFLIPALNLGGIPPLSGFIGKVALFFAGVLDADWLTITLVAIGALTSLLTLYVIGRTWNQVFWRSPVEAPERLPETERLIKQIKAVKGARAIGAEEPARQKLPGAMARPAVLMLAVSIALTVFAGPLWRTAENAAVNLIDPRIYVSAVFEVGQNGTPGPDGKSVPPGYADDISEASEQQAGADAAGGEQ